MYHVAVDGVQFTDPAAELEPSSVVRLSFNVPAEFSREKIHALSGRLLFQTSIKSNSFPDEGVVVKYIHPFTVKSLLNRKPVAGGVALINA